MPRLWQTRAELVVRDRPVSASARRQLQPPEAKARSPKRRSPGIPLILSRPNPSSRQVPLPPDLRRPAKGQEVQPLHWSNRRKKLPRNRIHQQRTPLICQKPPLQRLLQSSRTKPRLSRRDRSITRHQPESARSPGRPPRRSPGSRPRNPPLHWPPLRRAASPSNHRSTDWPRRMHRRPEGAPPERQAPQENPYQKAHFPRRRPHHPTRRMPQTLRRENRDRRPIGSQGEVARRNRRSRRRQHRHPRPPTPTLKAPLRKRPPKEDPRRRPHRPPLACAQPLPPKPIRAGATPPRPKLRHHRRPLPPPRRHDRRPENRTPEQGRCLSCRSGRPLGGRNWCGTRSCPPSPCVWARTIPPNRCGSGCGTSGRASCLRFSNILFFTRAAHSRSPRRSQEARPRAGGTRLESNWPGDRYGAIGARLPGRGECRRAARVMS